MRKFEFSLPESTEELPLYVDTKNLIIKNKREIDLFDVIMVDDELHLDTLIFEKYGGSSMIEQFNVIKVILPLILIFNDINDPSMIQNGAFIKFPDLTQLMENIYIYEENDILASDFKKDSLPGVAPLIEKNKAKNAKKNSNKLEGIPTLGMARDKVTYNSETGIITY